MKKTVANTLHSGLFSIVSRSGRSAATEIPLNSKDRGVIHLPEVDGKMITQKNYESLKAHEYGHVAMTERNILPLSFITEMKNEGADDYLIQACMDTAVNSFIGKISRHLPFEHDLIPKKKFLEKFVEMEIGSQTSYLLQVCGVYYGSWAHEDVYSRNKETRAECKKLEKMMNDLSRTLVMHPYGQDINRALYDLVFYCKETIRRQSSLFDEKTFSEYAKNLILRVNEAKQSLENQKQLIEDVKEYDFPVAEDCIWGDMDIREMPLENSMMRNWKQAYKPKYMGSLRYMHRAITDMKVWGLKDRSIPPMTVLIDCSGSMSFEEKDVIQILERQPASIVAGYSGSMNRGSLYILGKNGKYAGAKQIEKVRLDVGYSNVVDGPALVWLSQQKGRKIWISDGNVTGMGESQSAGMFEFVDQLLKAANIEMYRSLYNLENGIQSAFYKRTFGRY